MGDGILRECRRKYSIADNELHSLTIIEPIVLSRDGKPGAAFVIVR